MSARQMKRALAEELSAGLPVEDEIEDTQPKRPTFAFSDSDTSSSSSDSEEDEQQDVIKPPPQIKPKNQTKPKSKQKKSPYDEDNFLEQAAALARKEAVQRAVAQQPNELQLERIKKNQLFAVTPREFSVENELKRKFGSAAVATATAQTARRGRQGRHQPRGSRNKPNVKKMTYLVKADPQWPRPPTLNGGGIGMIISEGTNQKYEEGCTYFCMKHGTAMNVADMEFQQRIQTHDPNQIQMHVRNYPYHPPGLYRMVGYNRFLDRNAAAIDTN